MSANKRLAEIQGCAANVVNRPGAVGGALEKQTLNV